MINIRALALSLGIIWGGAMLVVGWIAPLGYGGAWVTLFESLYIGYGPGLLGGVIGGIWGFIDAAIAGLVLGWLYNWFSVRFPMRKGSES